MLASELQRYSTSSNDTQAQSLATDLAAKSFLLGSTLTANDVKEFYFYYVTRGVYATLGAGPYAAKYTLLEPAVVQCEGGAALLGLTCPNATVTLAEAEAALLRHADTVFSSVTTAGSPLPLWSEGDGTGELFQGSSPVGGSGIDMSANILSLAAYLNATLYGQPGWSPLYEGGAAGFADPASPTWAALVLKNPIYAYVVV